MPTSSTKRSGSVVRGRAIVGVVVAGDDDPPVRDGPAEHARPRPAAPARGSSGPGRARRCRRQCVNRRRPGRRVEQVEDRAVGRQQPGGLLGRVAEQVVDVGAGPRRGPLRGGARARRSGADGARRRTWGRRSSRLDGGGRIGPRCGRVYTRAPVRRRTSSVPAGMRRTRPAPTRGAVRRGRSWARREDRRPRPAESARLRFVASPAAPPPDGRTATSTAARRHLGGSRERVPAPRPHRRRHRAPLRHRRPDPGHRLHPRHPRRPAVHPQRDRLRRGRDRDDRPDLARRPLPLGRPPGPHRLRGDRHRHAGRSRARTTRPPTSPRASRSR